MALRSGRVGIHPSQVDPITGMLLNGPTPGSISFEDLSDAQITDPEIGQTLQYNGTGWHNVFASISPTTLAELRDVEITDPEDGEYLTYDSTNEKWVNSGAAPGPVVPDGKTVLPTDDIETWLECAGITDKAYTTLNEVLADSTTLLALMSNNNASDYLVRSKSWTTANGLVPTMTSDTTPSGTAFANSERGYAYLAFDGNDSTYAANQANVFPYYLGYTFPTATVVRKVYILPYYESGAPFIKDFKIQGSNDGFTSDVNDLYSGSFVASDTSKTVTLTNTTAYTSYRLNVANVFNSSGYATIKTVQFYATSENQGLCDNSTAMTDIGANNYCANTLLDDATWRDAICNSTYFESVLNVKVPTMTSNTTPSGECFALETNSEAYKAFNGIEDLTNPNTYYSPSSNLHIIGYKFTSQVKVYKIGLFARSWSGGNYKFQASNDNSNWIDITEDYDNSEIMYSEWPHISKIATTIGQYQYYRLYITTSSSYIGIASMQFYGRQDI